MIPRQHRIAKQKKRRTKKLRRRLRKLGDSFHIYEIEPDEFKALGEWDA